MMLKLAASLLLLSSLVSCDQAEQPKDLLCDICIDIVTDLDEWITSDSTMADIIEFVEGVSISLVSLSLLMTLWHSPSCAGPWAPSPLSWSCCVTPWWSPTSRTSSMAWSMTTWAPPRCAPTSGPATSPRPPPPPPDSYNVHCLVSINMYIYEQKTRKLK